MGCAPKIRDTAAKSASSRSGGLFPCLNREVAESNLGMAMVETRVSTATVTSAIEHFVVAPGVQPTGVRRHNRNKAQVQCQLERFTTHISPIP